MSDKERQRQRQRRHRAEKRRREELRKEWERQRQHIADTYFYGDVQRADDVMEALPFSAIPTWEDVENVIQVLGRACGSRSTIERVMWGVLHDEAWSMDIYQTRDEAEAKRRAYDGGTLPLVQITETVVDVGDWTDLTAPDGQHTPVTTGDQELNLLD